MDLNAKGVVKVFLLSYWISFFTRNFTSVSLSLASFITWMYAYWAALSSVLVKISGYFILVFIVYLMSGFNSHQLPAVPAAVIACCQNCRCISTRSVLSVRELCILFIRSEIHHECLTNLIHGRCMVALHRWCLKLETCKFVHFSTYPEMNEKAFWDLELSYVIVTAKSS